MSDTDVVRRQTGGYLRRSRHGDCCANSSMCVTSTVTVPAKEDSWLISILKLLQFVRLQIPPYRAKVSIVRSQYIHNWPLQHFSQDYDLASCVTYVVWVNFIYKWRNLQFKVDSKRQICEMVFKAVLFALRIFAGNLLRDSRLKKYIFFS